MRRLQGLVVVGLQLVLQQAFQLVRVEVAAGNQAQAVGDELHHVVVGHHDGVFLENVALGRVFDVPFDGQDAVFAGHDENVVNELEQLDVFLAPVTRALDQAQRTRKGVFHDFQGVADEEGAERRATDDHHFKRVPEQQHVAATHHEAAQHTA